MVLPIQLLHLTNKKSPEFLCIRISHLHKRAKDDNKCFTNDFSSTVNHKRHRCHAIVKHFGLTTY